MRIDMWREYYARLFLQVCDLDWDSSTLNPPKSDLNPFLSLSVCLRFQYCLALFLPPPFFLSLTLSFITFPMHHKCTELSAHRCYYSVKSYLGPLITLTPVPVLVFEFRLITFPHKVSTKPTDSASFKDFQRIAALGIPRANPRKYHFSNMRKCSRQTCFLSHFLLDRCAPEH